MATATLRTKWTRPTLMIFSEKLPVPVDKSQGLWDIGGDDRTLTITAAKKVDGVVTLQLSEPHGLSVGDNILIDGLDKDSNNNNFDGSFVITNNNPNNITTQLQYNFPGEDYGDHKQYQIIGYRRKSNYTYINFKEPHDLVEGDTININSLPTVSGKHKVIDASPGNSKTTIKIHNPGKDTGDNVQMDILNAKRDDGIVTLLLDNNGQPQLFEKGDRIRVSKNFSDWTGEFDIISASPAGVSYKQSGLDTFGDTTMFYVESKKREDNVVTLQLTASSIYDVGDAIYVYGLGKDFDGPFIVTANNVGGDYTKIRYNQTGDDTGDGLSYNIISKRREDNQVTLKLSTPHTLQDGDQITITGLSSSFVGHWENILLGSGSFVAGVGHPFNGTYTITDNSPGGDKTKVRIYNEGPDTGDDFISDSGSLTRTAGGFRNDSGYITRISKLSIISKKRANNVVTLKLSEPSTYKVGNQITVYGLTDGFNGNFTIKRNNVNGDHTLIQYDQTGADTINFFTNGFITDDGIISSPITTFLPPYQWYDKTTNTYKKSIATRISGGGFVLTKYGNAQRLMGGGMDKNLLGGTLTVTGQDMYYLTDDNRSDLGISVERIEYKKRMINGRMRSYHVADKKTFNVSWKDLETLDSRMSEYTEGSKYIASAKEMVEWYENHNGSFYLILVYDAPNSDKNIDVKHRLEYYEVFFDNFSYNIKKRGKELDFWDISMALVEA